MRLTSEQRALRDSVRALLTAHLRGPAGQAPRGGRCAGRLCAEIGVAGLAVPEEYGGAAAGPVETHVVAEELGRHLIPAPLLGSAVLASQALLATGDRAACARLLPAMASGPAIAALAWATQSGHWDPLETACRARPAGHETAWALEGTAHYVLYGHCADVLLVAARAPDGMGLFEVDPRRGGLTRTAVTAMDPASPMAVVELAGAAGRRIGGSDASAALSRARDLACITLSAEQAGAAQRALELTVGYTTTRVQFGRIIGSFQVLQHRLADLHVLVESARSMSYAAAAAAAAGTPDLGPWSAAAKVACSEALTRTAAEMIQLHGAIGVTWEHDAHRYFKRAHSSAALFGPPAGHLARVAAALLDQ